MRETSPPVRRAGHAAATRLIRRLRLYLLLLPALLLELLVHLLRNGRGGGVVGVVMDGELHQFYIRDWGTAPWAASTTTGCRWTSDAPARQALCCSPSASPSGFTPAVGRPVLADRHGRRGLHAGRLPRARAAARPVPGAVRAARLQRPSSPGCSCSSTTTAW
ncbi:hypothetical protein LT493_22280 [Streptomyces tricolor]|nr:hypothetical protein [Streptomyces tricolor]